MSRVRSDCAAERARRASEASERANDRFREDARPCEVMNLSSSEDEKLLLGITLRDIVCQLVCQCGVV